MSATATGAGTEAPRYTTPTRFICLPADGSTLKVEGVAQSVRGWACPPTSHIRHGHRRGHGGAALHNADALYLLAADGSTLKVEGVAQSLRGWVARPSTTPAVATEAPRCYETRAASAISTS